MAGFFVLAAIIYCIGKAWKESFFVTLRFLYPLSVMAALAQIWFFLPKWSFLQPRLKKAFRRLRERLGGVFYKLGDGLRKLGRKFGGFGRFFGRNAKSSDKRRKTRRKTSGKYRDEILYAEGSGLFGSRRRHLKWRDMKTNQDKIRFFYMKYAVEKVKEGRPFAYHLTPGELKSLWKNPEGAEPITGLYYQARYSSGEIEDGQVEAVKNDFSTH